MQKFLLLRRVLMLGSASTIIGVLLPADAARAQNDYPSKPISLIVGTSAGGPSDSMARILADALSRKTGYDFIVENKPGASGALAADYVRRADPDGYTILYGFKGQMTNAPLLNKDIKYSIEGDFQTVAVAAYPGSNFLLANAGLGIKTFADFMAQVKAKPGEFDFATTGPGVSDAVAAEAMKALGGLDTVQIAYPSNGEAILAAAEGHADLAAGGYLTWKPHYEAGKVVPLVTFGDSRNALLPDVPAITEVGLDGFAADIAAWKSWFTLYAPKGTPADEVEKLNELVYQALADETLQQRYAALDTTVPAPQTPAEAHKEIVTSAKAWIKLLIDLGQVK